MTAEQEAVGERAGERDCQGAERATRELEADLSPDSVVRTPSGHGPWELALLGRASLVPGRRPGSTGCEKEGTLLKATFPVKLHSY